MLSVSKVAYQATTTDTGVIEVLYEGNDLKAASDAALAHDGKSSVYHFDYNSVARLLTTYANGQCVRGYVYTRGAVYSLVGRAA